MKPIQAIVQVVIVLIKQILQKAPIVQIAQTVLLFVILQVILIVL